MHMFKDSISLSKNVYTVSWGEHDSRLNFKTRVSSNYGMKKASETGEAAGGGARQLLSNPTVPPLKLKT